MPRSPYYAMEAEQRVPAWPVREADVFVPGDRWQGNALWVGDALTGLIDWDCAGAGPAGVDLGSLRCDAAVCFYLDAADGPAPSRHAIVPDRHWPRRRPSRWSGLPGSPQRVAWPGPAPQASSSGS